MKDKEKLTQLITLVKKGDSHAFEELYYAYVNNVYFKAMNYFHNESLARDIVQEVFLRVYKNIEKLDNASAFYTWLMRITYNVCNDYDKKKEQVVDLGDDYSIEQFEDLKQKDAKAILENKELQKTIYESMQTLKTPLRTVGILRYYDELSVSEIADILQIPEGTVHSRLYHMKEKLRETLETQGISAKTVPSFVLSPMLFKLAYAEGLSQIQFTKPLVFGGALNAVVSQTSTTGAKVATTTKIWIASSIGVAGLVGGLVYNQQQDDTPVKQQPVISRPVTQVEEAAKITAITYPEAWTNEAFELQVSTSNEHYDEILVNGSPSLTISQNGSYLVSLNYEGKQVDERRVDITNIDLVSPQVSRYDISGTTYTITLEDDLSQIDYESMEYEEDGNVQIPNITIDPAANLITITCDYHKTGTLRIYDYARNPLTLKLKDGES
ncbi:hypothetical protein A4S06_02535 [Erysipelotrichaceae bacterium MTC7]|nr:hypothetical protein A4S06_02535 [Erysipelotrichaceae bacterium MTC7]